MVKNRRLTRRSLGGAAGQGGLDGLARRGGSDGKGEILGTKATTDKIADGDGHGESAG